MKEISLPDEAATTRLGTALSSVLRRGDLLLLSGNLGMGKTSLARAIIRGLAGAEIDVPSPTFALIEAYDFETPLHHVDLYRLDGAAQIVELGLDELYEIGITLIEWPDRAEGYLPEERLEIEMREGEAGGRRAVLRPVGGDWPERLGALLERGTS